MDAFLSGFLRSLFACFVGLLLLFMSTGKSSAQPIEAALLSAAVNVPGGRTALDEVGIYQVTYRYRDGRRGAMPVGWIGHFEDQTGISCTPFGTQGSKAVFLLHPPWRGGTGVTDQILRLTLPKAKRLSLRFAVAMKEGEVGPSKSDGARFRVSVDNRVLLDQVKTDAIWTNFAFDLSSYAGKTITLDFQTDPGPADNPSFDYAFWGNREIVAEGAPGTTLGNALAPLLTMVRFQRSAWGGAAPGVPALSEQNARLALTPGRNKITFPSDLSAVVTVPASGKQGAWTSPAFGLGFGAYLELVGTDGKIVRSDSALLSGTVTERVLQEGRVRERTFRYQIGARHITVAVRISTHPGDCVKLEVRSDDPYIAGVHFGDIGPAVYRRSLAVPYLGTVTYFPQSGLFGNVIPDYTLSHASSLNDGVARYLPLTNGRRNPVRETVYYALAPTLRSVLPMPPNPPSPYRDLLADKVVLDVWGGSFRDNAAWLRELASYRLTHLLTICHDWQHGGYDNQLPDVLPAQAGLGGDAAMKTWSQAAVGLDELFALHENYVDFYPNAPTYNDADVARDSEGKLVPAWKNLIQSYALAPDAILKYARKFTPDVHARYHTNASYLDVHSAVPPWFHVDFRADQPGAGEFLTVWNVHRDLWKLFRDVHQGPVLGEGANHWYWSGLLDGVEAQFGVGVPGNGGQTAPLLVDFDLWNIHPLQFNHGMGYLERWLASGYEGEWQSRIPTMKTLDQYRMQEVAYGHAGFIASALVRNLPFVWQEHHLLWPLSSRYATAQVVSIKYEHNGALSNIEAALRIGCPLDRVEIGYDNGLTVWANEREDNWTLKGREGTFVLPQYGWLAESKDFRAGTLLRPTPDGSSIVADSVEMPGSYFVNARSAFVLPLSPRRVSPGVESFKQLGHRRFQIKYTWDVREAIPTGYVPFIHVTGQGGTGSEEIVFQPPIGLSTPPDRWPVGSITRSVPVEVTLPIEVKDGDYTIVTGIYAPEGGERLALIGNDDGHRRYTLGTLTVAEHGKSLRFQPTLAFKPQDSGRQAEREAHSNPQRREISFREIGIRTSGSFLLERERDQIWLLTPFPRDHPFHVQLQGGRLIGRGWLQVEALDAAGHSLGQVPVARPNVPDTGLSDFDVNTIPGAVRYRIQHLQ